MKKICLFTIVSAIFISCNGQSPKTKTITIINGDTTITGDVSKEDVENISKDIQINISENDGKTVIVKNIVSAGDSSEAMTYAFSEGGNVEITTDDEKGTQKIVVRSGDKRAVNKHAEKRMVNIKIDKTSAHIYLETGKSTPLTIVILDESGHQVFSDMQEDGARYEKDIELKKKGTYFMNIIQDKKSDTETIVIE